MGAYFLKRLLGLIPVLLGITLLVFLFLQLIPGDPAEALLGERASAEEIAKLREKLGLNKPLYVQYLTFLGNVLRGDLGTSAVSTIPVAEEAKPRKIAVSHTGGHQVIEGQAEQDHAVAS